MNCLLLLDKERTNIISLCFIMLHMRTYTHTHSTNNTSNNNNKYRYGVSPQSSTHTITHWKCSRPPASAVCNLFLLLGRYIYSIHNLGFIFTNGWVDWMVFTLTTLHSHVWSSTTRHHPTTKGLTCSDTSIHLCNQSINLYNF